VRMIYKLDRTTGSERVMSGKFLDLVSEMDASIDLETLEWIHNHKTRVILECSVV